jgi:hypothetical protein
MGERVRVRGNSIVFSLPLIIANKLKGLGEGAWGRG